MMNELCVHACLFNRSVINYVSSKLSRISEQDFITDFAKAMHLFWLVIIEQVRLLISDLLTHNTELLVFLIVVLAILEKGVTR